MTQEIPREEVNVSLNNLSSDMKILAYIGFTNKYRSLSKETCLFLTKIFKGTNAVVDRDGRRIPIAIQEVKEGDRLCRIHRFPKSLKRLTDVNDQLVRALRKHGILGFQVSRPVKLSVESKKELQDLIDIVNTQLHG